MLTFTLDPRTALIIATLMMLLNGGVLGLMHRGLAPDVQPSADDWRIGTLLAAAGSVLFAAQLVLPAGFAATLGNACYFTAMALYWRAVRRFRGLPDSRWLFAPAAVAIVGVFYNSVLTANLSMRIIVASVAWTVPSIAVAWLLLRKPASRHGRGRSPTVSERVLGWIFVFVGSVMMLRVIYFVVWPNAVQSVLERTSWVNMITPLLVAIGPVIGTTAFLLMCTERMRQRWEEAAATDDLTGLPNRRTLSRRGAERWGDAQRGARPIAVAVIDVDHFKAINDRFGHDAGDVALKHVAHTLARHCRGDTIIGRPGGEEFIAIFDVDDSREAVRAAERLRAALAATPLVLSGTTLFITASMGVGVVDAADSSLDDLLRRADAALYVAKANGRNRVELAGSLSHGNV
jgi:diguanylate cyclase (GGDEF)-like protein